MLTCTICNDDYWPTGRWREDICPGCFEANFAASQELRVQEDAAALQETRRQIALLHIQTAQARRAEEDAP